MAYQYRRPYYPRVYGNQYRQPNQYQGVSGAIETGTKMGEQIAKIIAQRKQDQIANQLAAQYGLYAPRAQWVGGTPPAAGVNTQGTSLADQGGVEGLKLRMAMAQQQQNQQSAQAKAAYQTALAQQQLGKGKSVWTGRTNTQVAPSANQPGKTAKYQAGAYNFENGTLNGQKTPDSMAMLQEDINGASGSKTMATNLLAAIPQMKIVNGQLTITPTTAKQPDGTVKTLSPRYRFNSDGSFSVLDANGNPTATLPKSGVQMSINRYNAMQIRNNQDPLPNPYLQPSVTNTNFTPGTKENPFKLDPNTPNTTFRAIPPGSYFIDQNNNTQYKPRPDELNKQPQTAQQQNAPTPQFSTPSEGGGTDLFDATRRNTGGVNIPLRPTNDDIGRTPTTPSPKDDIGRTPATPPPKDDIGRSASSDQSTGDNSTIAQIDPNTFAPPTQQDRNQVADVTLPNRDVVPTVTDDDRDMLNRMIAGQNLIDQYSQT